MLINQMRFCHYISGVLANQQADPLCRQCKAYANTITALRESVAGLQMELSGALGSYSEEMRCMFAEACARMAALRVPENALGQKKAGNCKMPEGVCLIKSSKAMWDRI